MPGCSSRVASARRCDPTPPPAHRCSTRRRDSFSTRRRGRFSTRRRLRGIVACGSPGVRRHAHPRAFPTATVAMEVSSGPRSQRELAKRMRWKPFGRLALRAHPCRRLHRRGPRTPSPRAWLDCTSKNASLPLDCHLRAPPPSTSMIRDGASRYMTAPLCEPVAAELGLCLTRPGAAPRVEKKCATIPRGWPRVHS